MRFHWTLNRESKSISVFNPEFSSLLSRIESIASIAWHGMGLRFGGGSGSGWGIEILPGRAKCGFLLCTRL
jgi:hypothetical protein